MASKRFSISKRVCAPVALATLGATLPAQASQLLLNSSFELPVAGGNESTVCDNWTFLTTTKRATFQHHGTGLWSVWERAFEPLGGITQNVAGIVQNTNYALSCWYFFEPNFPASGAIVDLKLDWNVGPDSTLDILPGTVTTGVWTQYTLNTTAPAGATSVVASFNWRNGSDVGGPQSAFVDEAALEGLTTGISNWNVDGSGDWNVSSNWSTGIVPNGVGVEADLLNVITGNHTIFSDTAIALGTLTINNSNTYVIAGAGSLTMQTGSGSAFVNVQAGTQKVNLPLTIASNTTLNVSGGATLKVSDPVTVNAGRILSQSGAGAVNYESTVTVLTGAGLLMSNGSNMAALTLASTANATLTTNGNTVLRTAGLSMAGDARLDMNDNDLIVTGSSYSTISGLVANARSGGAWTGPGITSTAAKSNAQHNTSLGVITGMQYRSVNGVNATFDGYAVVNTDVLLKYTYYGDTDLNGKVDGADYARTDATFNNEASQGNIGGWFNGDFDYNNKVDGADYALIDASFNSQGGTVLRLMSFMDGSDRDRTTMAGVGLQLALKHFDTFGEGYAAGVLSAVPEPATSVLMLLSGLTLCNRRMRGRKSAVL